MMEQEVLQSYDVELEEGELTDSSDADDVENADDVDVYTPLQRPAALTSTVAPPVQPMTGVNNNEPLSNCGKQLQEALEEDICNEGNSNCESLSESSSNESTDSSCLKKLTAMAGERGRRKKRRTRRTVMVRVQPTDEQEDNRRRRFKKYDIWTASLQEDALMENMRGIGVTAQGNDRSVENYDFSLKYRLNGENCLKRRLSNSTDDISDSDCPQQAKRGRSSSGLHSDNFMPRKSVKSRLDLSQRKRVRGRHGSSSPYVDSSDNEPMIIADLEDTQGRTHADVAREMAKKLLEPNDELFVRILQTLGTDVPMQIYTKTQRIESEGGMLVKDGKRRRTPGGVFLFLLKLDERLTSEERKTIFQENCKNSRKMQKELKAMARDRKVEELKKRLAKQDLPALHTRKDLFLLGSELNIESQAANLSNPPPSPVGQEQSPEYKTHAINHVQADASPEKPSTSASALAALATPSKEFISYDDDFLDVNCTDMDFW